MKRIKLNLSDYAGVYFFDLVGTGAYANKKR